MKDITEELDNKTASGEEVKAKAADENLEQETEDVAPVFSADNETEEAGSLKDIISEAEADAGEINVSTETAEDLKTLEVRTINPPKKRKFGWISTVLLLVVIGLGIYLMFGISKDLGDEPKSFGEVIAASDWKFALICLAVLIVVLNFDWLKYFVIMRTTTGKYYVRTSMKVQLLGKFYDNVTPFAAGGQPMQIYYLHKKGFSGGVSSAVVLIKYFTQMFCVCLISLLFMACNSGVLNMISNGTWRTLIPVAAWIGLSANMLLPLMVLLFVIFPKFARKLVGLFVGIGAKLRIVKDKERTMEKAETVVREFRASFRIMSRKPFNLIALVLMCVIEISLRYAFPYFILRMYSGLTSSDGFSVLIAVMTLNVYATQSVAVIPTPGNSGAIESVGTIAFSAVVVAGSVLSWSVFTWRFSVYYIYILAGLGLTVFEFIRKLVRSRRRKKSGLQ